MATAITAALIATAPAGAQSIEIARSGAQPSVRGAAETFTGSVVVDPMFRATEHTRASAGHVFFQPGARSAWHTHPAGQTLIVTSGIGWIQQWGGEKREIRPGDVIWIPPNVKHWHGGSASNGMSHIAIQEHVLGKVVDWLEQVGEEQYRR